MKKNAMIFSAGSIIYPIIEILWRGHTHYSMAIAGGLSLMLINTLCIDAVPTVSVHLKAALSAVIITAVEFTAGVIFNLILKMNVWDYSALPYNILGQICLPFSFLWYLIAYPALWLCSGIGHLTEKYGLITTGPAHISFPDSGQ